MIQNNVKISIDQAIDYGVLKINSLRTKSNSDGFVIHSQFGNILIEVFPNSKDTKVFRFDDAPPSSIVMEYRYVGCEYYIQIGLMRNQSMTEIRRILATALIKIMLSKITGDKKMNFNSMYEMLTYVYYYVYCSEDDVAEFVKVETRKRTTIFGRIKDFETVQSLLQYQYNNMTEKSMKYIRSLAEDAPKNLCNNDVYKKLDQFNAAILLEALREHEEMNMPNSSEKILNMFGIKL